MEGVKFVAAAWPISSIGFMNLCCLSIGCADEMLGTAVVDCAV
jgi:hypothetical protein